MGFRGLGALDAVFVVIVRWGLACFEGMGVVHYVVELFAECGGR